MSNPGFLAIWCDIPREHLTDYRNWLTQEHIADRIFLSPGFRGARLFARPDDECSHFFLYDTEGRDVLKSPTYVNILNNPSPWTKAIMPKFGPFDRAAGEQLIKLGVGSGAFVAVGRIKGSDPSTDFARVKSALSAFLEIPDVVGIRLMRTDRSTTGIKSQEKTMRTGVENEGAFDYLLVAEALSERGASAAKEHMDRTLKDTIPGYRSHDSSTRRMIYGQFPHEAAFG